MKNLKNLMCILSILALCLGVGISYASAQTAPDNYLKMRGKILDGHTADITVFQENSGDWTPIRTMKSRKNYILKLNPESNYYVLFETHDGLNKVLYIDAGSTGMWVIQLDINFDQRNIKYARVYQHPTNKDYAFKIIHKDKQRIVIGRDNNTTAMVLSEHTGK